MAEDEAKVAKPRRAELLIGSALRYTGMGLSVLPIHAASKTIDTNALRASGALDFRGVASWRRFSRRPATEHEIRTWFSSGLLNLAIVAGIRNLLILDFDRADSFEAWGRVYGDVAARTSVQKSARGFHVLFYWPLAWTTVFRTGMGFRVIAAPDILAGSMKGPFEYLVSWPSIHPTGWRYRWLPGQAPWEVGILRIDSLEEVGIVPDKRIPGAYFAFLANFLTDPALGFRLMKRWISYRFRRARGLKDKS